MFIPDIITVPRLTYQPKGADIIDMVPMRQAQLNKEQTAKLRADKVQAIAETYRRRK